MSHDLSMEYYWRCYMGIDTMDFVSRRLTCQYVKYEHQKIGEISLRISISTGSGNG